MSNRNINVNELVGDIVMISVFVLMFVYFSRQVINTESKTQTYAVKNSEKRRVSTSNIDKVSLDRIKFKLNEMISDEERDARVYTENADFASSIGLKAVSSDLYKIASDERRHSNILNSIVHHLY